MTTLHIVRHGNTFAPGQPALRIGARTDIPLVKSGRDQAKALGRHFADTRFDRAFVSPLARTRETAALILAHRPDAPTPEAADWLAEIDHGPDEGLDDAAIVARIGTDALARWDEAGHAPPGWQVDASARIAAWQALYAAVAGGDDTILIVTSNGAARFALMAQDPLLARARALPSLKLRTGAWGTITVDAGGTAALRDWDRRPD